MQSVLDNRLPAGDRVRPMKRGFGPRTMVLATVLALLTPLAPVFHASALYAQEEAVEPGMLVGRLLDGVLGGPLAGAPVFLVGTDHITRTDAEGRFRFERLPPGRYYLKFQHPDPLLDGVDSPPHLVEVGTGAVTTLTDAFGSEWAAEQLCRNPLEVDAPVGRWTALMGRVRDAESGRTIPGALVWLLAEKGAPSLAIQADSSGAYLLCEDGPPAALILQASTKGALSDTVTLETPAGGVVLQDLAVSAAAPADLEPGANRVVSLRGTVRSAETGEPVSGARVRILEADLERVTGEEGTFLISAVPRGHYRLVTEHMGMTSDTAEVDLTEGAVQLALLTLETRPVPLPTLDVVVERTIRSQRLAGFYRRMEVGLGHFVTREDLETADVVGALRRLPSVNLSQCVIVTQRKANCYELSLQRGPISLRGGGCPPLIYLDGHLLSNWTPAGDDDVGITLDNAFTRIQQLPPGAIEGIEVHRNPATAPGRFRMLGDACGIVLVWTRDR